METCLTLLDSLKQRRSDAWESFVSRYGAVIRRWAGSWKVPPDDVEDLLQDVYLKVLRRVSEFERERAGSFRAWLKVIARHCWLEVLRSASRRKDHAFLSAFAGNAESLRGLQSDLERLADQELLIRGMDHVRGFVDQRTWEAFYLTTIEGLSGAEVAERLSMPIQMVYVAKCRVKQRLANRLKQASSQ
jgi:RNA polymerase sigma-70 factor (ECF subfamily)